MSKVRIYLGAVETTRRVKKLVFNGTENLNGYGATASGVGVTLTLSDMLSNSRMNGRCTHFTPQLSPASSARDGITFGASDTLLYITFSVETATALNLTDTTSVKTWLQQQYAAGTPVIVWYVLAEPETAVVNEPLMKIGDYADTLSMGQAGVEIPTARGTNTLDVLTDVKPSEIYIKYNGEPVPQLSMLSSRNADEPEEAPEELSEEEAEEETSEETESITPETEE